MDVYGNRWKRGDGMKRYLLLAFFLISTPAFGSTVDNAFVRCLIEEGVEDPHNIPEHINEICLLQAGVEKPSEELKDKANRNLHDCLIESALEIDDRVSPAGEVAAVISNMCHEQWRKYGELLWIPPGMKRALINNADALRELAALVVFQVRNYR